MPRHKILATRRRLAAAVAMAGVLAIGAPVTSAGAATTPRYTLPAGLVPFGTGAATAAPFTMPGGFVPLGGAAFAPGSCGTAATDGQGPTGGVESKICQGSGLVFVGPAVGQIANVMGPTIIGPAVIGTLVVSAGNVAAG